MIRRDERNLGGRRGLWHYVALVAFGSTAYIGAFTAGALAAPQLSGQAATSKCAASGVASSRPASTRTTDWPWRIGSPQPTQVWPVASCMGSMVAS